MMGEIKSILKQVAIGEEVSVSDSEAIKFLLKKGYLFESNGKKLCFASNLHLSVWMNSYQRHPMPSLIQNEQLDQFIFEGISRMSTRRLLQTQQENNAHFTTQNVCLRERQLHMLFAESLLNLLPENISMVVEWRTEANEHGRYGYIDIAIQVGVQKYWFLELLVNGVNANEHFQRFETGGKYSQCLLPGCKFALIDFRQAKVRETRDHFVYVQFLEDFKQAQLTTVDSTQIIHISP